MMQHLQYEISLVNWRHGFGWSERLAARYLALQGCIDVIPQAPLGGGDGGKDISFNQNSKSGLAGCYFPAQPKTIARITKKFSNDLDNACRLRATKFYFITGQRITATQKDALLAMSPIETVIVDVDALLVCLPHIASFIDGTDQPRLSDAQRVNDVECLRIIVNSCDFFNIENFLYLAPESFGEGFLDHDSLIAAFNGTRIHFYDELLYSKVRSWWDSWKALTQHASYSYDLVGRSGAYFSLQRNCPNHGTFQVRTADLDRMNSYLEEIADLVGDLRATYRGLVDYIRQFYPDALIS